MYESVPGQPNAAAGGPLMRRFPYFVAMAVVASAATVFTQAPSPQPARKAAPAAAPAVANSTANPAEQRAVLDKYCVTCHNTRLKTGGLSLDDVDVSNPTARVEVWEKVIRKVSTAQMPPPGRPRPSKDEGEVLVNYLTSTID